VAGSSCEASAPDGGNADLVPAIFIPAMPDSGSAQAWPLTGPCAAQPTGDRLYLDSADAVRQAIHGTWQLCTNVGLFDVEQWGVLIGPDDRYDFLDLVDGQVVAKPGLLNKGHLEYLDEGVQYGHAVIQVTFVSDMNGFIDSPAIFSGDPRMFFFSNEGVEMYIYAEAP
jgi:hypothetical protein